MPIQNGDGTKFVNSLGLKGLMELHLSQEVQIKSYTVEPASHGNGHMTRSELNRVYINFSTATTKQDVFKVIAKVKPLKGTLIEEFNNSDAFEKETLMYTKVIPILKEHLQKYGVKLNFAPQLIHAIKSPTEVLFLEDLSNEGFSTESPSMGLNLEQSKFALEKLAFFHAASACLIEKSPELLAKFDKGTFHQDYQSKLHYFTEAFRYVVEHGKELGIDNATLVKLKQLPSVLTKKAIETYTDEKVQFKVLNHGDFYTSNILFKYGNNGKLTDCVFVDYQNCFVGSPVIDLIYFLTTSVAPEVLETYRNDLIYAYHDSLDVILTSLDYQGQKPTLLELQVDLLKKGALEVIFTLTAAPYLRSSDKKIAPAIIPSLYNDDINKDFKSIGITMLKENKEFLLSQLNRFSYLGLFEWGVVENKVRGIMGRFQQMSVK
uniref:CSON006213 protein n=1 Tax=Culicoides sonorensis TaxID=179676 RepID=A0A336MVX7_CULSO